MQSESNRHCNEYYKICSSCIQRELTNKDIVQLEKEKDSIVKELTTNNRVERYYTVFKFCELYQSWALKKKAQQEEDITKQENFEICPELPLKIIH